jgi:excisionase family DNA binding protein
VKTPRKRTTLSTLEAARILGVAVSSVSKWIDDGALPAGRTPGGHRRIERDDLVEFLRRQKLRIPPELGPNGPMVVIVDDERPVTSWLKSALAERFPRAEILEAHDGFAAGQIIGLNRPEVVLLDIHMPGIDGFEVCRRIKADPETAKTSVVAISGDTTPETRQRALDEGADSFLTKPLDLDVLLREVTKAFDLRQR